MKESIHRLIKEGLAQPENKKAAAELIITLLKNLKKCRILMEKSTIFNPNEFIATNLEEIIEASDNSIFKSTECTDYILDITPPEKLLTYRSKQDLNLLTLIIRYGGEWESWKFAEKLIPPNLTKTELKNRLEELVLKKDETGLSLIDYCFMKRKIDSATYFESLVKKVESENGGSEKLYDTPSVLKFSLKSVMKTDEVNKEEIGLIKKIEEIGKKVEPGKSSKKYMNNLIKNVKKLKDEDGINTKPYEINLNSEPIANDGEKGLESFDNTKLIGDMRALTDDLISKYSGSTQYFRLFSYKEYKNHIVDTPEQLEEMLDCLLQWKVICFDVEFCFPDSQEMPLGINTALTSKDKEMRGVRSVPACIQIAIPKCSYWLDTIKLQSSLKNNPKFVKLMTDSEHIKVFHSCEADIGVIYNAFGIIVRNIFDTSKAMTEALKLVNNSNEFELKKFIFEKKFGKDENFGLGDLAKIFLGLELDKSLQVAMWRIRPLPEVMMEYAVSDAVILCALTTKILELTGLIPAQQQKGEEKREESPGLNGWQKIGKFLAGSEALQMSIWAKSNRPHKSVKRLKYTVDYDIKTFD